VLLLVQVFIVWHSYIGTKTNSHSMSLIVLQLDY